MRKEFLLLTCFLLLFAPSYLAGAQTAKVPNWTLPGSPTHKQVAPLPGFHRPVPTEKVTIGIFGGQSDMGSAVGRHNGKSRICLD